MRIRNAFLSLCLCLLWLGPALAQGTESTNSGSGLATLITFLPMIIFFGLMVYLFGYLRKAGSRAKRCEQHMDKVEELLDRVVAAVEKQQRE